MANHPCTWMYSKWAMFRMLQFIDFKLPGGIHRKPPKQIQANGSACGLETKAFGGSMNSHDSRPSLISIYHTSLANCTYKNYNQLSYCLETLSSPQLLIVWEIWMPIPPFMTGNSQLCLENGNVFVARRSAKNVLNAVFSQPQPLEIKACMEQAYPSTPGPFLR
jgi:hypothetical protein